MLSFQMKTEIDLLPLSNNQAPKKVHIGSTRPGFLSKINAHQLAAFMVLHFYISTMNRLD